MYDLPRRFNFGLLSRSDPDQDVPWPQNQKAPPWPASTGAMRQHNVEYWMTLDLLGQRQYGPGLASEAVRVRDPAEADVFFVPFFSSLNFDMFGRWMRDPDATHDRALQAELVAFLQQSKWWEKSSGRDHVLPIHHPNALRFFREQLNSSILVVSEFGRMSPEISRLGKDVVALTLILLRLLDTRRTHTHHEGRVRRKLEKLLSSHPRVHFVEGTATFEGIKEATDGMRSSLFCLHPAGDTPSSCRLFDAIASQCVPVIITDKIELPFEDVLDDREFCLFFSVEEALRPGYLLQYLEGVSPEKWLEAWSRLKDVAHHFSYEGPSHPDDSINMIWRQVRNKLPAVRLAVNRSKRLRIQDWVSCSNLGPID